MNRPDMAKIERLTPSPPAARGEGALLHLATIPLPIALVSPDGSVHQANPRFRAVSAEQNLESEAGRRVLSTLHRTCLAEGSAAVLYEGNDELLTLEALWPGDSDDDLIPVMVAPSRLNRSREHMLRALCDLVWSCDATGRIVELSDDSGRLFGAVPTALRGRSIADLFVARDRVKSDGSDAPGLHFLEDHRGFRDLILRVRSIEPAVWLNFSGVPRFDLDGRYCGHSGIAIDVTRHMESQLSLELTQIELRANERELKRANAELQVAIDSGHRFEKLKQSFLSNLNHEFHTPLNAIVGSAEMLSLDMIGHDEESRREHGRRIAEAGRRLAALFDDILEMACIESGNASMRISTFSIADEFAGEFADMADLARASGCTLDPVVLPKVSVSADLVACRRILRCLFDNALNRTPQGQRLGCQIACDVSAGMVKFTFWDQGEPVPPAMRERVFQPFVRPDASEIAATADFAGLGLAMARAYARLQEGDLELEGAAARGNRFTFRIPLACTVT